MKMEEILEAIELDSELDKTNLDGESLKIAKVHSKYLRMYAGEKRVLNSLKARLTTLIHDKYEYYGGKSPAEVYKERPFHLKLIKSDIGRYVEADVDVVKLASGIDMQEEKLYVIQEFIKSINQRSFNIKNALSFMQWSQGGDV